MKALKSVVASLTLAGVLFSSSAYAHNVDKVKHPVKHPHCTTAFQSFWVTGYTATGRKTATGTWPANWYTVGVDPHYVPYGSYVQVLNRSGKPWLFLHAEDTGNISGAWLDVFVPSNQDAYNLTGRYTARFSCSPHFD